MRWQVKTKAATRKYWYATNAIVQPFVLKTGNGYFKWLAFHISGLLETSSCYTVNSTTMPTNFKCSQTFGDITLTTRGIGTQHSWKQFFLKVHYALAATTTLYTFLPFCNMHEQKKSSRPYFKLVVAGSGYFGILLFHIISDDEYHPETLRNVCGRMISMPTHMHWQ